MIRRRAIDLEGKVALVTGGSRGLGLIMARKLAEAGADVAICARDAEELKRAREYLESYAMSGVRILDLVCDVGHRDQVDKMVNEAAERLGPIDIVINNAGIIQVGPFDSLAHEDFSSAMDVIFWGTLNTTFAALPLMRAREGRIVNITSIGGKVAVPHLLPYAAAKFATVGFSEGLYPELRAKGIRVVTIVPGLMRTGSFLNALVKGKKGQELNWFSLGASLPGISMSAERAADRIIKACREGTPLVTVGLPAKVLRLVHALAPAGIGRIHVLVNGLLPSAPETNERENDAEPAHLHRTSLSDSTLNALGHRAARRYNQLAG